MTAPAAAGAISAAGMLAVFLVPDHAGDNQADNHNQDSKDNHSSHNGSFLSCANAGDGGPSPAKWILKLSR